VCIIFEGIVSVYTKISLHTPKSMSKGRGWGEGRQREREIWSEEMRKREWTCSNQSKNMTSKKIVLPAPSPFL